MKGYVKHSKVATNGIGMIIQRLQQNIVDVFPGIPPHPYKWSLEAFTVDGHTHIYTHTYTPATTFAE